MSVDADYLGVIDFVFPVVAADYPPPSDVMEGVVYGEGAYVGTMPCGRGIPFDQSKTFYHSPAQIIQKLLTVLGLGTLPSDDGAWPTYAVNEPDIPDEAIIVYDTAGIDQGREMVSGFRFEKYGLQVLVRASDHETGYTKSQYLGIVLDQGVYDNVVTLARRDGGGDCTYFIKAVKRTSPVYSIGGDTPKSKRRMFTINATATINRIE